MTARIRAMTICQPWAWAIAAGHKRVENRTWRTSHRGELLIHAGRSTRWLKEGTAFLEQQGIAVPPPETLEYGVLLAIVRLVDCVAYDQNPRLFDDTLSDPFASGPVCWLLEDVRQLSRPIPYVGCLGLWSVDRRLIQDGDNTDDDCHDGSTG